MPVMPSAAPMPSWNMLVHHTGSAVSGPATVEVVVLPPVDTSRWTREGLDDEVRAIRDAYLEVLDSD